MLHGGVLAGELLVHVPPDRRRVGLEGRFARRSPRRRGRRSDHLRPGERHVVRVDVLLHGAVPVLHLEQVLAIHRAPRLVETNDECRPPPSATGVWAHVDAASFAKQGLWFRHSRVVPAVPRRYGWQWRRVFLALCVRAHRRLCGSRLLGWKRRAGLLLWRLFADGNLSFFPHAHALQLLKRRRRSWRWRGRRGRQRGGGAGVLRLGSSRCVRFLVLATAFRRHGCSVPPSFRGHAAASLGAPARLRHADAAPRP